MLKGVVRLLGDVEVMEAHNGEQGLEQFKAGQPDLVLLDVDMPVMDGIQCLKKIMALDAAAKVIMVTSVNHRDVWETCLLAGASGYIQKENSIKIIRESIEKLLQT